MAAIGTKTHLWLAIISFAFGKLIHFHHRAHPFITSKRRSRPCPRVTALFTQPASSLSLVPPNILHLLYASPFFLPRFFLSSSLAPRRDFGPRRMNSEREKIFSANLGGGGGDDATRLTARAPSVHVALRQRSRGWQRRCSCSLDFKNSPRVYLPPSRPRRPRVEEAGAALFFLNPFSSPLSFFLSFPFFFLIRDGKNTWAALRKKESVLCLPSDPFCLHCFTFFQVLCFCLRGLFNFATFLIDSLLERIN